VASLRARGRLRAIRRACTGFIDKDARQFARVVAAMRAGSRLRVVRELRGAIEIPCRVCEEAQGLEAASVEVERQVSPRWRADVKCAGALARAAAEATRALVEANLAWLNDPAYSRRIMGRLSRRPKNGSSATSPRDPPSCFRKKAGGSGTESPKSLRDFWGPLGH
jgi:formiminotetrahydrofolate cyclodeaminase